MVLYDSTEAAMKELPLQKLLRKVFHQMEAFMCPEILKS